MAIHEACHASVATLLSFPIVGVRVSSSRVSAEGRNFANATSIIAGQTVGSFYYEMLVLAAGRIGEISMKGLDIADGPSSDTDDLLCLSTLVNAILGPIASPVEASDIVRMEDRNERLQVVDYVRRSVWRDVSNLLVRDDVRSATTRLFEILKENDGISRDELPQILEGTFSDENLERKEPNLPFPNWYQAIANKGSDELLELRRNDFADMWQVYSQL